MRVRAPQGLLIGMIRQDSRAALTPPYTQMMQRKTSLSQEQGSAGSNPALRTMHTPLAQSEEHLTLNQGAMGSNPIRRTLCAGDGTGILARLRTGYLRVRIPPCAPFIRL